MKLKSLLLALIVILAMALTLTACTTEETPPTDDPEDPNINEPVDQQEAREWWEMVDVEWTENTVALDTGINMTYMVSGPEEGIPIILIHGATDSRLSWAQIVPDLADTYRVYVPELRGHGKTDKPAGVDGKYTVAEHTADIIAFMDAVNIEKANIVGHSLGSMIAQNLAIDAADRVTTITLIASGASTIGNETLQWVYDGDGTDYLGVHGYDDVQALPESFIREWTACTNEDEDFNEGIYMHAASLPYEVWAYIFGGAMEFDNTDRLAEITCPVQLIWGTADVIFSAEDEQALQDGLTSAAEVTFQQIEGASHNTHWDSQAIASQVAGLIADFVRE